jgi:hypothetical protein
VGVTGRYVWSPDLHVMRFDSGVQVEVMSLSGQGWIDLGETGATADKPLPAAALFAEQVQRWNIDYPDGRAVPVTLAGLLSLNIELIRLLVGSWVTEVAPIPHSTARTPAGAPAGVEQAAADVEPAGLDALWAPPADPAMVELGRFERDPLPGERPADPDPVDPVDESVNT